jgi:thiopeptide-type bacteriocin biosynthesis protein
VSQILSDGYFMLRTPTLPWDVVRGWSQDLEACRAANGGDLAAALERDTKRLRTRLREIVRRPEVLAALRVASPSLCGRLQPWLDGDETEAALAVEPALVRYVVRMAGRATPFGLFAGTTLGVVGPRANLGVPATAQQRRHSHLDLDFTLQLAAHLSLEASYRPYLRYRANETLYEVAGQHRYHVLRFGANHRRSYSFCSIAASRFANVALDAARAGDGATTDAIAAAIVAASSSVSTAEAVAYVGNLVKIGILTPTLLPATTGADPLAQLIDELERIPVAAEVAQALARVRGELAALDAAPFAVDAEAEERIVATLRALAPSIAPAHPVRVDLRKPSTEVTVGQAVLDEVARAAELITRLMPNVEPVISDFVEVFEARYQDREVPLLEVLDPEVGIGFELATGADLTPLVKDLTLEAAPGAPVAFGRRGRWLLRRAAEALRAGAMAIELSAEDIDALAPAESKVPPAGQSALVTVVARSAEAVDAGDYQLLVHCLGGTTATTLTGRFLHDDLELAARARATLRREEALDPDALHAEVAHHIEGVAGLVNRRPHLREFEIDVAGGSSMPPAQRIPLDDLLLSVRDGRLVLRSRRHGRRVVPHLSSAHAYTMGGFAAYRLLTQLQLQTYKSNLNWSWGEFLEAAPFLPRVTCGRVVLSLARWKILGERIDAIKSLRGPARFTAVQTLRRELRLPRQVRVVDGDNVLPVDLDNVLSVESMLGVCKRDAAVVLTEQLPGDDELVARGSDGGYHHELIVPLLRAPSPARTPAATLAPVHGIEPRPDVARRPGEDWLYLKLYCGMSTLDRLLVDFVQPLVTELRAEGAIDRWFFLRYNEGGWHMRLRLHGAPPTLWTEVAPRLLKAAAQLRAEVHRVAIDTYDPEVERYGGGAALALAEQLFEADSDAAAAVVAQHRADVDARWRIALFGMNALLDALGFSLADKQRIVEMARNGQAANVRAGAAAARQMGEQYRTRRLELEALVAGLPDKWATARDRLHERSTAVRRIAPKLRELDERGQLVQPLPVIATSHLHMWANRVLRGSQNLHEYVLYDFLHRIYRGAIARGRDAAEAPRRALAR